ncbi:MAG: hypothetical protein MUE73_20065, partial [Planctomycetes bacterium]|nr:hypothetical protein [Planctomycetota bacterium]
MRDRRAVPAVVLVLLLCGAGAVFLLQREIGVEGPPAVPAGAGAEAGGAGSAPVPPDGAGIVVGAGGPATGTKAGEGDSATEPGEDEPFSFDRATPHSVSVRIVDAAGGPLDGAVRILAAPSGWLLGDLPRREAGRFSGHLPEAGSWIVEADCGGTLRRAGFEVSEARPAAEVEVRFEGTGTVSGKVCTSGGPVEADRRGEGWVAGQLEPL